MKPTFQTRLETQFIPNKNGISCELHSYWGMTLLELLVTIAIISIFISIVLPAVQRVRRTAYQISCVSQVKQLGLASHDYHGNHNHFPPACDYPYGARSYRGIPWTTNLLPYLDQPVLAQQALSLTTYYPILHSSGFDDHYLVAKTLVPIYLCPAEKRQFKVDYANRIMYALKSYLGICGTGPYEDDGIMIPSSDFRLPSMKRFISAADVTDGLSNTLIYGERPPSEILNTGMIHFGGWYMSAETCEPDMTLWAGRNDNSPPYGLNCRVSWEPLRSGRLGTGCHQYHFWSLHGPGATFALADGSARFIRNEANSVLRAMASRAGGEVFTLD